MEMALLNKHADEIANLISKECLLIEPGSGSSQDESILNAAYNDAQGITAEFNLSNATEITSPSGLPYRPSSVLRQQLHSQAMRLLSRLEYERSFGASSGSYFLHIPNVLT